MQIVTLGTGTGIPAKGRGCAGVYCRVAGEHVVLDAGSGTLRQLFKLGVSYLGLDRIFLTHFHPDHCLDLVSMLFAMRIPQPAARTKPLTVYGPRGLKTLYRRLNTAFHGWIAPRTHRLTLRELDETTLRLGGYTVRTKRMRHSTAALGYRIEAGGKSVAYSGDTDACPQIVELGRKADLLILECSMPDARKVAGHLTPAECGRIARHAGCRHLVLTHFYPAVRLPQAARSVRRIYRGRLTLAKDLQRFTLSNKRRHRTLTAPLGRRKISIKSAPVPSIAPNLRGGMQR